MRTPEQGRSAEDGVGAAARLLEVATRNADELLAHARAEAASITAAAQADAQRARAELEKTRTEVEQHRIQVLADLAEQQTAREAELARLADLEEETRTRMRTYLTEKLSQIESQPEPEIHHRSTA